MSSYPPVPPYTPPPAEPFPWGPFTAGELMRRLFALYRQNAAAIIAICAVGTAFIVATQVPMMALQRILLPGAAAADPQRVIRAMPFFLMFYVLAFLLNTLGYAVVGGGVFSVLLARRRGEPADATTGLSAAFSRFGSAWGATVQVWLRMLLWWIAVCVVMAVVVVFVALAVGMSHTASASSVSVSGNATVRNAAAVIVAVVIFGCAALLFMLWQLARYFVALGALYAEGTAAGDSIRRSIALSRHNKGRIYALFAVFIGISLCVGLLFGIPAVILLWHRMHGGGVSSQAPVMFVLSGVQIIFVAFYSTLVQFPLISIGMSLCYFDLRARADAAPVPPPLDPLAAPPGAWSAAPPVAPTQPQSAGGWPIAPASSAGIPAGDYGPYLSAKYDAPRTFRSDPGKTAEAAPEQPEAPEDTPKDPPEEHE